MMTKGFSTVLFILSALLFSTSSADAALDVNCLTQQDVKKVESLIAKLTPLIKQRREKQNIATLTFEELYAPLDQANQNFLRSFQNLDSKQLDIKLPYRGIANGKEEFVVLRGQKIMANGKPQTVPPQFLTREVYQSYTAMMNAMQKDIGKRLYVESGYRSSAYQLYLFVSDLKKHKYSIRETAKLVALPGYSEHGNPQHQAIDFINEAGINQDSPREFENLPEYEWLLKNASKFDFVLSYPKNSKEGIAFEPWHWRHENNSLKGK